ncbi:MAG: NAD(P)/FAD-dependent oxidoreductase [Lachnospiraceae bacterium]|nr:NAD(P)/FAD-dependent oxidoreductase [Lachnospiraceae bacterium]
MTTQKRTALVVGAGPGGSTAAFYLAKQGVDVLFVDKETWPRDKTCGGVYLTSLYPMLKEMGCFDAMYAQQACNINTMRLINRKEDYIVLDVDPFMIAPRRFTDDQIRRAAIREGADFLENYEATSLIMRKGVVKGVRGLYHNEPMDIEADVTIIANGAHSELSRQLGAFVDDPDLTMYCFRGYIDGVEGLVPGQAEEYYVPQGVNGWSPICTTWLNPHYEPGQAVLGMTITEKALRESGMTMMEFYEYWRDNTKFGRERLHNAKMIDKLRGWRLPGSRKLAQSVYPGAILIGDAISAAECAFEYGIPSAMVGGQIAAGIIADCAAKDDFDFDMLNRYQAQASAALDPGLQFNGMFRDELLNKEDVMNDFFDWVKKQTGYPHLSFSGEAMKYMHDVLGLEIGITANVGSQ